jgi:putative peptidoglycan lipid II flippase
MILSGSFVLGRVLGLIRNALFAFLFGATATSDAYLQALLLPDLFFNIVAGGALGSAFLPVFARYLIGEKDERSAWQIASTVLNSVLVIMCILAMLAIMLAPWLVPIYSPGVPASELALIVSLTRLLLLQTIIMSGGVVIHAILSARQNFWLPALGTVLYNVGLIVGLLPGFFVILASRTAAHTTFAIYAATIGVTLGALLQVGIQIPGLLKERVRYSFTFDWKHPGVVQIARQMLPRLFNTAMLYLSLFVDRILILALIAGPLLTAQQGLVTQYYQALQLLLLPLGVFGMAVSTAAFPSLAEQVAQGNLERVRRIIDETLRSILFLSIPCGIGLIVLGVPLIQVLLQHGAFHLSDSTATSIPLAFFGLGLAGLTSVELLTRAFYAFRDNRTPVLISIGQFVLKMLLSLLLLRLVVGNPSWGLGMLAFATSLAGLIEAGALLWFLQRKIGRLALKPLAMFSGRVTLAALAMGAGVFLLRELLDLLLITTISPGLGILGSFFALFKLLCELALGILIYVWATRQFGIEAFWKQGPVRRLLERFKLSWI